MIDRFSPRAAHLLTRDQRPDLNLPAPGAPIDLDRQPFVTQGLAPNGVPVRYYNFDVQTDAPATLYRFRRGGAPVAGQPDVVDRIPGDSGYNDFWRVAWVEVPANFVAGSIAAASQVHGLPITPSTIIIDCPIVPGGTHGAGATAWLELAYRGQRIACLHFGDDLTADQDRVPTSPIYVTFAPSSAFETEGQTPQTHNVVMSVPGDADYSPLWAVHVYDRAAFDRVHDAATALAAPPVDKGPLVNCPIVATGPF